MRHRADRAKYQICTAISKVQQTPLSPGIKHWLLKAYTQDIPLRSDICGSSTYLQNGSSLMAAISSRWRLRLQKQQSSLCSVTPTEVNGAELHYQALPLSKSGAVSRKKKRRGPFIFLMLHKKKTATLFNAFSCKRVLHSIRPIGAKRSTWMHPIKENTCSEHITVSCMSPGLLVLSYNSTPLSKNIYCPLLLLCGYPSCMFLCLFFTSGQWLPVPSYTRKLLFTRLFPCYMLYNATGHVYVKTYGPNMNPTSGLKSRRPR